MGTRFLAANRRVAGGRTLVIGEAMPSRVFATVISCLSILWTSSHASEVTSRVLDQVSLPTIGHVDGGLTRHQGAYYFSSAREEGPGLWRTDGRTVGTVQISDQPVSALKVSSGRFLYYWEGEDLWRTDGTPNSITLVNEDFGEAPAPSDGLFGSANDQLIWLEKVPGGWELLGIENSSNQPQLIRFIERGGAPVFAGKMISGTDGSAYFVAPDRDNRRSALWKTHGTEASTRILETDIEADEIVLVFDRDVYFVKKLETDLRLMRADSESGEVTIIESAEEDALRNPSQFLIDGQTLFFQADDRNHGAELWMLDAGTNIASRVADIREGKNGSSPRPLAVFQEKILAMAKVAGKERLWSIPFGDAASPQEVDWLPEEVEDHFFHQALTVGDEVYLISASTEKADTRHLSRSDGSEAGSETFDHTWITEVTSSVDDNWPYLYSYDQGVLFPSNQLSVGTEIYRMTRADEDPVLVRDANSVPVAGGRATIIQPDPNSDAIQYFTINSENEHEYVRLPLDGERKVLRQDDVTLFGWSLTANLVSGTTFFLDQRGLWSLRSGGTEPGLVFRNGAVRPERNAAHVPFTTTDSGILFMAASSPTLSSIYHSDGVVGGRTVVLVSGETYLDTPIEFEGLRYFVINQLALSRQPWITTGPDLLERFFTFQSTVTLIGKTRSHLYMSQGNVLWSYSGRNLPVNAGPRAAEFALDLAPAADEDDRFYYIGADNRGEELWITDGTVGSDKRLTDIQEPGDSGAFAHLTTVKDRLFFAADDGETGMELWWSDGSEEGTRRLIDLRPGEEDAFSRDTQIPAIGALGDYAYFSADDGIHGRELWRVHRSGTPIEMVHDIIPGPESSNPHNFTNINGRLFFQASDPVHSLLTLREIVSPTAFPSSGQIHIRPVDDGAALSFGETIGEPYLLLESLDLIQWQVAEAFTGEMLGRPQSIVRRLPEDGVTRYFRLAYN